MITKDMTISEAVNENHQAEQILMTNRIGCGRTNINDSQTIEEACIEHGVNLEHLLRELNFNRYY